ncbi:isocitrate lyase/PEP mutase family protein [Nocardioides sp. zg-536]|uniref:Isocitrate lyase/PEP mutase family protein n=1 Tax=Nocardioides faecalis TaxID=2803858 RepID=A0A939BXT5_9ACTN|nr:isocitrate lyase/PEP mutase family protein [Nocardioides faecalis]MBM9459190.1 isocitrate lyase/PEP mutase family protein [Nocardioides faecalis]MBS4751438.1 isocitrate lyase/PEP mutase family protein [Nocardioides faecalis]QVI59670.1 isocitrate lyase/PEP mutase family protein [Nocardioides faecalis]
MTAEPSAAGRLRELLAGSEVVRLPGVHDAVSAGLAAAAGARGVHLSGAAVSAVDLGLPDLGFVHGTDIARRAASLVPALAGVPVLADADTGYGNALQARHTARSYAAAGIAGLHLEDQVAPKRCGHLGGKEVVGAEEAAARVAAAVASGTDLVVVARTDALSVLGREEAVTRCRAFAEAGADAVFVEGAGVADLHAVAEALAADGRPLPQVYNRSEAGGPVEAGPDDATLAAAGVRLVIHPVSALLAAADAVRRSYAAILADGHAGEVPRMSWPELTGLVGLPGLLRDEQTYAHR